MLNHGSRIHVHPLQCFAAVRCCIAPKAQRQARSPLRTPCLPMMLCTGHVWHTRAHTMHVSCNEAVCSSKNITFIHRLFPDTLLRWHNECGDTRVTPQLRMQQLVAPCAIMHGVVTVSRDTTTLAANSQFLCALIYICWLLHARKPSMATFGVMQRRRAWSHVAKCKANFSKY